MKIAVLLAVLLGIGTPLRALPERHSEQSCIIIPDESKPLPKPVVRVIMDSEYGAFARKLFREQGRDPYKSAPLRGVRVVLTDSGGPTYLVGGSDTVMTGADNRWYWLVQQSGDNANILLYIGTGCVQIESNTTRGYRNVWTRWQTAGSATVREYRWNGRTYKLYRKYNDRNAW